MSWKKEVKCIYIGKEELKLLLFANDMVLYLEHPKTSTKNLLELINKFKKVAGLKSIPIIQMHSYTSVMNSLKEK